MSFLPLQTLDPTKLRGGVGHERNLSTQGASFQSLSPQLFFPLPKFIAERGTLRRNSFPQFIKELKTGMMEVSEDKLQSI